MTAHLIEAMNSLSTIMDEESDKLRRGGYVPELGEIANAKLRLTGRIEAEIARLKRENMDWLQFADEETRDQLADASRSLRDASNVNQAILARQIEISVEMMAAIAAEAKRVTGTRSITYGASGGLGGMDAPAPIRVNTRL